ncbi:MAG TPA: protease HtpX, partial [Woeseiaceae bacterium]
MFKRVALFIATNLAVLLVLSVVLRLLGVDQMLDESGAGINYEALLILSVVIGFGGSFISLALSKWMAKRSTGAKVIESPSNDTEAWLFGTVQRLSQQAGIDMPEIAIYDAPDMNAFATGARRNSALVAVSTGLLRGMKKDEVEAVLAHEIAHVANGDMVTLTLVQGVVNTFVIFLSRIVGHIVD